MSIINHFANYNDQLFTNPRVSICCITYNQVKYISQAIESFLSQKTNFHVEIVIHDDASDDGTSKIIESFAIRFPEKIRATRHLKNKGMMHNFLGCIHDCRGEYIAICEGDDYWTNPDKLQQQVDFLEQHANYAACFHNALFLNEDTGVSSIFRHLDKHDFDTKDLLARDWFIPTHSIVYRRNMVEFPEWFTHIRNGDYALLLLISLSGEIYGFHETWGVYRAHNNGASMQFINESFLVSNILKLLGFFNIQSNFAYETLIEEKFGYWLSRLVPIQNVQTKIETQPKWLKYFSLKVWLRKAKKCFVVKRRHP